MHTATLVGTKIYFLGGSTSDGSGDLLNDFFYLDISKSFDKTEQELPFVDLIKLQQKYLHIMEHQLPFLVN
jgi:hypothetical protein